jgi:hypothetical protein
METDANRPNIVSGIYGNQSHLIRQPKPATFDPVFKGNRIESPRTTNSSRPTASTEIRSNRGFLKTDSRTRTSE